MKDRLSILLLTTLLLTAVGYVHVFQKMVVENRTSLSISNDLNSDAEENSEKSEESARETDLDEDPIKLSELMTVSLLSSSSISKNGNYSLGLLGYYPEIVSPPPQN